MMRKQKSTCRLLCLEFLEDRLCPSSVPVGSQLVPLDAATPSRVSQAYGQLPLSFEANQGQARKYDTQSYAFIVLPKSKKAIILEEDVCSLIGDPPVWKEQARLMALDKK